MAPRNSSPSFFKVPARVKLRKLTTRPSQSVTALQLNIIFYIYTSVQHTYIM